VPVTDDVARRTYSGGSLRTTPSLRAGREQAAFAYKRGNGCYARAMTTTLHHATQAPVATHAIAGAPPRNAKSP